MPTVAASLSIDDSPAPDLFLSLLEMDVEEDHRLATTFRIKLSIQKQDDGMWTFLDDDRLQLWKKLEITATVADGDTSLITGYVTRMNAHIADSETDSFLELRGMDATCLMNLEEKIKDWPGQSDSDIASQILSSYGLTAQVDDTSVVHDDTVSTIIQRDTDIQFLKRLAWRNGFECVVRGDTAYFQKPPLSGTPLPVLAAFFGPDTNVNWLDVRMNGTRPMQVEMHQIDAIGKQVLDATAVQGQQTQLGSNPASSLSPPGGATSKMIVRHRIATGQQEMTAFSQAVSDEAEWFIEATGEVDSLIYGSVLQSRQLVPIKGVGGTFSGMYYVTQVKHSFTVDRYMQKFTARRNASVPKPSDFGGSGLPF